MTKLLVREQQARAELARAHEQLREYAVQAERLAAAQERNRVARDIHDGLGHALTVVQMQIKAARAVLATEPGAGRRRCWPRRRTRPRRRCARCAARWARCGSRRPSVPLPEALRALAEETSAAGVPTEVEVTGPARPLLGGGRGVAVPGRAGGADQRPQARPRDARRAGARLLAAGRGPARGARRRCGRRRRRPTPPASACSGYASAPRTWAAG